MLTLKKNCIYHCISCLKCATDVNGLFSVLNYGAFDMSDLQLYVFQQYVRFSSFSG